MNKPDFSTSENELLGYKINYAALALAIIHKAALDLHSSNPACAAEARAWLILIGISWCQMLGISETQLAGWEKKGFALSNSPHRNWRY